MKSNTLRDKIKHTADVAELTLELDESDPCMFTGLDRCFQNPLKVLEDHTFVNSGAGMRKFWQHAHNYVLRKMRGKKKLIPRHV